MNNYEQQNDRYIPSCLSRSLSQKTKLSVHDFRLQIQDVHEPSPLKRRKSLTGALAQSRQARKNAINIHKEMKISKLQKQLETEGGMMRNGRIGEDKISNINLGKANNEDDKQGFPSIKRMKSLTLDLEIQKAIDDKIQQKMEPKPKIVKFLHRQKTINKEIDEDKEKKMKKTESNKEINKNQCEKLENKKIFYINNLGLQNVNQQIKYQSQMASKILNKFKQMDKRNNKMLHGFQKKMSYAGPHQLVAKKLRYDQIKRSPSEFEERRKRFVLMPKKTSTSEPIIIKQENYVNGWEAEQEMQTNYGWL